MTVTAGAEIIDDAYITPSMARSQAADNAVVKLRKAADFRKGAKQIVFVEPTEEPSYPPQPTDAEKPSSTTSQSAGSESNTVKQ